MTELPDCGSRTFALSRPTCAVVALLLLLLCGATQETHGASADQAPAAPSPHLRSPLAVSVGAVDAPVWEHAVGSTEHGHAQTDLFLRTPPDSLIAALIDSTSVDNMIETIVHLQDYGSRYVVLDSCWDAGYWIRDQFEGYGYADVKLDTGSGSIRIRR